MSQPEEPQRLANAFGAVLAYGPLIALILYLYLAYFHPDTADQIVPPIDRREPRPAFIPH